MYTYLVYHKQIGKYNNTSLGWSDLALFAIYEIGHIAVRVHIHIYKVYFYKFYSEKSTGFRGKVFIFKKRGN